MIVRDRKSHQDRELEMMVKRSLTPVVVSPPPDTRLARAWTTLQRILPGWSMRHNWVCAAFLAFGWFIGRFG